MLAEKRRVDARDAVFKGFGGIYCVEAGGPAPGVGCAGRGIITAVELLKQQRVFEDLDLDIVIYDVLGDVVCGGFAVPVREGIAEHVFTVSSADFMAIYAANNLFRGIEKFSNSGGALLGGIIANSINTDFQREIIEDFAERTSTPIVQFVPRSMTVTQAELSGKTTIEAAPNSEQADVYRALARTIAGHEVSKTPTPLTPTELREWSARWARAHRAARAKRTWGTRPSARGRVRGTETPPFLGLASGLRAAIGKGPSMTAQLPRLATDTLVLHGGSFRHDPATSATAVPIYQSTSFDFPDTATAIRIVNFEEIAFTYSRVGNPTVDAFEQRLAVLEGGAAALGVASGQAATALAVLTLVEAGDNIVSSPDLYGGTVHFFKERLKQFGIEARFVDPSDPENFRRAADARTRLFFGESLPNPKLSVFPIAEVAAIGRPLGIPLIIDNTAAPARHQAFRSRRGDRGLFGDQIHRRPRNDDRRRHRRQRQVPMGRLS